MDLFLDICQGIGLAVAVGIRPFLPGFFALALAFGDLGWDLDGTPLEEFEIFGAVVLAIGAAVALYFERRARGVVYGAGPAAFAAELVVGALVFGGSLADRHDNWWPGLLAGAALAYLAWRASSALLRRTQGRLDAAARRALPLYADGIGVITVGLTLLLPPFGLVAAAFMVALLVTGRRREGQKYAGLRILR